jgi:hypothetical protein
MPSSISVGATCNNRAVWEKEVEEKRGERSNTGRREEKRGEEASTHAQVTRFQRKENDALQALLLLLLYVPRLSVEVMTESGVSFPKVVKTRKQENSIRQTDQGR